ncbi:ABC transporter substrate-binding protein [Shinella sp.]|uniref:ABC transporter substrate-binding protein n=1 Tax=Shinella sp. TaxID=1870904 RepID=UPI003F7020EB
MHEHRKTERSATTLAAVALAIAMGAYSSQPALAMDEATLEAARQEGSVVIYSASPSELLDSLTKAFNTKYPGITAEYYRAGSSQVYERLIAEQDANRVNGDIIHVSDVGTIAELKEAGRLVPYASSEYAAYDPQYVDPDKTWFVARAHFLNIAYNAGQVSDADAPKSLRDLADPKFKGKVGIMDVRLAGGAYTWQYAVWKLYGPEFFAEMAKNEPKLFPGHGPINDRIITGELLVGVSLNYMTDEAILEKGAPIKALFPTDGAPMIWSPVGIVAKAPHPNAAKVMMDFLASPEGQQIFNSQYSYSLHPAVKPREGMVPLSDIKVLDMPLADMIAQQNTVQTTVRSAWGY